MFALTGLRGWLVVSVRGFKRSSGQWLVLAIKIAGPSYTGMPASPIMRL